MDEAESLIRKFFDEYKIALHPREFNRYLLSIGESTMPEGVFARAMGRESWPSIVFTLYRRSKKHNPFITTMVGAHKRFELPYYTKHAFFCYPRGHEEYLWARFIFMPFSKPGRTALWAPPDLKVGEEEAKKEGRKYLLAQGAPIFALKKLFEHGGNLTPVQLAKELKLSNSGIVHAKRYLFEPHMKHLVGKFLIGSPHYTAGEYALTTLAKRCYALAFDKEWQRKYFELERNKVFAWHL